MEEIEVKFLDIDEKKLAKILLDKGAKKSFEGPIEASYFDFPDHSLKTKKVLLRLRKKGNVCELVSKTKSKNEQAKIAIEDEIIVSDFQTTKTILENIGLEEVSILKKFRTSYTLNSIHFEFDTLPGIPTFLEIEAPTIKELEQAAKSIGLQMSQSRPWGGKDVIDHYAKKGVHPKPGTWKSA